MFFYMWQSSRKIFRLAVMTSVETGSCLVWGTWGEESESNWWPFHNAAQGQATM